MAPHVLRHVTALGRLMAQDAAQAAAAYRRVAVRAGVGAVAGLFALVMACTWVMAATWDTPYRTWAAGGLTVAFAIVAIVALGAVRRGEARAALFAATRRNVALDRELYAELRPETVATPPPPPEQQLSESRAEIRRVAEQSAAAGETLKFPRSRTMQVLTRGGPAGSAALLAYWLRRRRRRRA
jgi:uncharacterized membrane protein YqjE